MKRIKTFDNIRGMCIFLMVLGHMLSWWIMPGGGWLTLGLHSILGDIAGIGFLFISGISAVIFFRSRINKATTAENVGPGQVKNEYLFRALLLLIIALIYNGFTAIGTLNPLNIWKWFIPLTIAMSLLMAFPLLKTSKLFRLLLALILWITQYFLLSFLLSYEGEANFFGILYHILYNSKGLHPILNYFSFFLLGTAVGDVIIEINFFNNPEERRKAMKNKLIFPSLIIGVILFSVGATLLFPKLFLEGAIIGNNEHGTFASTAYSMGALLISMSVLLTFEEIRVIKVEKHYKFFYFYSYYSLTIYFTHNLLYFVFLGRLNVYIFWIVATGAFFLLTLLIRTIYKRYGAIFSLKVQIGKISVLLARKVEIKKEKKKTILEIIS